MKISGKLLSIIGSSAMSVIPAVASAGNAYLYTAPQWADEPSYHVCSATNISNTTIPAVKIEVLGDDGNVLVETPSEPLAAGQIAGASNVENNYTGNARCRITVKGSARKIRGNMIVFREKTDSSGTYHEVGGTEIAR